MRWEGGGSGRREFWAGALLARHVKRGWLNGRKRSMVTELVPYFAYLAGAAASGAWVYRDAQKHGHGHPRSVAAGTAVLFPVGLLIYILSR